MQAEKIKTALYGVAPEKYDNGVQGTCAINDDSRFVEAHRGESDTERNLYIRAGHVDGASLVFGASTQYVSGRANPAVALKGNTVIEMHDNGGKLYYSLFSLGANDTVTKQQDEKEVPSQDAGSGDPTVAVNSKGVVVEVHEAGNNLRYRIGALAGTTLTWQEDTHAVTDSGGNPSVAIDDDGHVVVVYQSSLTKLSSRTGTYDKDSAAITWNAADQYDDGVFPSVALNEDGSVYEVHQSETRGRLFQRIGALTSTGIAWKPFLGGDKRTYPYDDGGRPWVAANKKVAMQVHGSATQKTLFATASLIFDRANWMNVYRDDLRLRKLGQLAFPGSHDAGSYIEDDPLATQTERILQQLYAGVRYFDLRPARVGNDRTFVIHHDDFAGRPLSEVISDVRTFMQGHNELVILKFSHYGFTGHPFVQSDFDDLVALLRSNDRGLRPWLLRNEPEGGLRGAQLRNLLAPASGTVLIVAALADDGTEFLDRSLDQNGGIRRYRDWYDPNPQQGDLRVFDIYGNTDDFTTMAFSTGPDPDTAHATLRDGTPLKRGQFPKFEDYDGFCRDRDANGSSVPCDLFLLSWTLTPKAGGAVGKSVEANKELVDESKSHPDPRNGPRMINVIYTDVVQQSRSADVALLRNGLVR
ncbi:MAG TPA: hypothetical protein VGF69_02525 [Thermoanaerobaculia bacterium]|jgi:hypothetical protein